MKQATNAQRKAWLRRAETLHGRAEKLLNDMIHTVGVEHGITDFADNVVCETEALCSNLAASRYAIWDAPNPAEGDGT